MSSMVEWAERQFREVEQNGTHATQIRLLTAQDNEVWETWLPPWPEPEEWAAKAEAFLQALQNEWPARDVPVVFVAIGNTGDILSRLPRKVHGTNKKGPAAGPWNSETVAVSTMVDNIALSMEKFQRLVNAQLDNARRQVETGNETIFQQTEYIKLFRQREALGEGENAGGALEKFLTENAGSALEILKMFAEASLKGAPKGAVAGLAKKMNGAASALKAKE